jgi:hypothetical protein
MATISQRRWRRKNGQIAIRRDWQKKEMEMDLSGLATVNYCAGGLLWKYFARK